MSFRTCSWLVTSVLALGCGGGGGSGAAEVTGSVQGTTLEPSQTLAVQRAPTAPLSRDAETLELYLAQGGVASLCPDIAEPTDEVYLKVTLRAAALSPGSFPVTGCTFECDDPYAEASWFTPETEPFGTGATGGEVVLDGFDGDSAQGTFELDFEGEMATGSFDMPIECVDDRG